MSAVLVLSLAWIAHAAPDPAREDARRILQVSGVSGGLVVHLGCGDGRLTAALRDGERYLVQGLDVDAQKVAQARRQIQSLGLYGPVTAERFDGRRLPYVDNLVNLIVAETPGQVPPDELMRVLAPLGVLCARQGGRWTATVKPWPATIDQWTHYLHGPDNNAVSRDEVIDVPRSVQWVAEPKWGRSHEELAGMSAAVSAEGRLFYIIDEAPLDSIRFPADWWLVGRDAFNGTLLWKRPVAPWTDHLRHFRSGPAHLPRRLIAVGRTVYVTPGLDKPVQALDAASGALVREYPGTGWTEEIVMEDGVLYLVAGSSEVDRIGGGLFVRGEPKPADFRAIIAIDAATARPLWRKDFSRAEYLLPLTLAVQGGRVYYQSAYGVAALDARTGAQLWRTPRPTPARRMSYAAPTLVAAGEVILDADQDLGQDSGGAAAGAMQWGVNGWSEAGFARPAKCTLRAYAAADGRPLWSAPGKEGYNSPTDLFVIDGAVWAGPGFQEGLDLKTGAPARRMDTTAPKLGMPHHRCYRDKATGRFILAGKSGIELLGLEQGSWLSNNSWIRGTCQYGILPANGLLYAPPNACACFLTSKVQGFFAAAPRRTASGAMPFPEKPVLEIGRADEGVRAPSQIGKADGDVRAPDEDWPTYRHDPLRSGAAAVKLPDHPKPRWSVSVGGRLTQPVVAAGRVFVASTDAHALHALDAGDGRRLWDFTAGGRIDSAPTLYRGSVLFGCADGWIYCLNAADGRLRWRFRAAPAERLIEACGRLESLWPVCGAVLVQNDTLYATAGRTSFLDGGLALYRLNPATGQELSKTVLCQLDPATGRQLVPEARFNMEGTTNDILSGDGEGLVFLKYFCFDAAGQRVESARPRLFSITGFLGEEWFIRTYWTFGSGLPGAGWGGWADAANTFPSGQILCFNPRTIYGYGRIKVEAGPVGHRDDAYHLFARDRAAAAMAADQAPPQGATPKQKKRKAAGAAADTRWSDPQSPIVRAMVLGGDRLAIAGPPDLGRKEPAILAFANPAEALAARDGKKGVALRIVSAADGKTVSEQPLPAMPVFDGMSAAAGRLYISLKDGGVLCLQ